MENGKARKKLKERQKEASKTEWNGKVNMMSRSVFTNDVINARASTTT